MSKSCKLEVRELTYEDLNEVHRLERLVFGVQAYTKAYLAFLMSLAGKFKLGAFFCNRLIGYVICIPYQDARVAHIASIAVDPQFRRRGIGSLLMERLEAMLKVNGFRVVFLETWVSNKAARAFYEARGYRPLIYVPKYYSEIGENAVMYVKLLVA